jgi:hypothetical protein
MLNNMKPERIEDLIRNNKGIFDENEPKENHQEHFLIKLSNRFKKIISIIPYLVRVLIVTVFIFLISIFVWYNYIYKVKNHPIIDAIKEKIETKK